MDLNKDLEAAKKEYTRIIQVLNSYTIEKFRTEGVIKYLQDNLNKKKLEEEAVSKKPTNQKKWGGIVWKEVLFARNAVKNYLKEC